MQASQRTRNPRQMGLDLQWGHAAQADTQAGTQDEWSILRQRLATARTERDQAKFELTQARQALGKAEQELDLLLRANAGPQAGTALNLDRELKVLIASCHPDKWQDAAVAVELTKSLNQLREKLQKGRL